MVITLDMLAKCTGSTSERANPFYSMLIAFMDAYNIKSPLQQAAFLSQIGEESGGFHWLTEIWGPTPAQLKYEFNKDLGNTQKGDGFLFRGRGLIQTTGRFNYARLSKELGVDFIAHPELLAQPEYACKSACLFWKDHALNSLADSGDYQGITRKINGGLNGYVKRLALFEIAKNVLAA